MNRSSQSSKASEQEYTRPSNRDVTSVSSDATEGDQITSTGFTDPYQPESEGSESTTQQVPEASTDGTESTAVTDEGSRPSQYVSVAVTSPDPTQDSVTEGSTSTPDDRDSEKKNFKCTTMNPFGKEQFYEIERSMVCDGIAQCSDGSDELNCPMRSSPSCISKSGMFFNTTHFGICRDSYKPILFASEEKVKRLNYDVKDLSRKFDGSEKKQDRLEQSWEDMETKLNTYELKLSVQGNELEALKKTVRVMRAEEDEQVEMLKMMKKAVDSLKSDIEKLKGGEMKEPKKEKCNDGEVQIGRMCFEYVPTMMKYEAAQILCNERGQFLASWNSEMNKEVQKQLSSRFTKLSSKEIWIGYRYETSTKAFVWDDACAQEHSMDITRCNSVTACGALFGKRIAGFKCKNERSFICSYNLDATYDSQADCRLSA